MGCWLNPIQGQQCRAFLELESLDICETWQWELRTTDVIAFSRYVCVREPLWTMCLCPKERKGQRQLRKGVRRRRRGKTAVPASGPTEALPPLVCMLHSSGSSNLLSKYHPVPFLYFKGHELCKRQLCDHVEGVTHIFYIKNRVVTKLPASWYTHVAHDQSVAGMGWGCKNSTEIVTRWKIAIPKTCREGR